MAKTNPWNLEGSDDGHEWNLLPSVGFTRAAACVVQLSWAALATVFLLFRQSDWEGTVVAWFIGALAVYYVTQRLGGREGNIGGGAPTITSDTPVQFRVMADSMSIIVTVMCMTVLVFGIDSVRHGLQSLLRWI